MNAGQTMAENSEYLDTIKRSVGKPLMFATPDDLSAAITEYFEVTEFEELTITGLALAIGSSRQSLIDYQKREGYGEIVKRAKCVIEHSYEVALRKNGRAGEIFGLKNFGWKDKEDAQYSDQPIPQRVVVEIKGAAIADTDTTTS